MNEEILIVDSSDTSRQSLEYILSEYDVTGVTDGKEMWDVLQTKHPALILLEVIMPGEDGFHIAAQLAQHEEKKDIPIIFITGRDTPQDIEKGFTLGAYDYIKKPFDAVELRARIRNALRLKKTELRLKVQSVIDPLTGAYNRRYFFEIANKHLEYIKRSHKNLSIVMIDIDSFKDINDTYGHQAGDFILKEFVNTLTANTRPYDIVARYGGEEFTMMFLDSCKDRSKGILQRIKDNPQNNVAYFENRRIPYSFSGGISEVTDIKTADITIDQLISIADKRLYLAKKIGNNIIIDDD